MAAMINRGRFLLGRQSSLAPEGKDFKDEPEPLKSAKDLEAVAELLYCACKGDVGGIEALISKGLSVDIADFDDRTALHLAACEGHVNVVEYLIKKDADVNREDRWGSTPLADAMHYENFEVAKLLESHGARLRKSSMRVSSSKEIPEYEIIPSKLKFKGSKSKLPDEYGVATWHGTKVAVKVLSSVDFSDERLMQFRDELDLLQRLRHPNVVQFLGAVTQSTPMMIVTEYLPQMDLEKYLKEKGRLDPERAISYALDIARGMNYLHEHKPESIIHRDLKPSNLLRDSKHVKVANFGLSLPTIDSERVSGQVVANDSFHTKPKGTSCRYMAPELYRGPRYEKSVDVFSFALIVQEMMEGSRPFNSQLPEAVAKVYAVDDRRPPFRHARRYPHGLKELIEECWSTDPSARPHFADIITRLTTIQSTMGAMSCFRAISLKCLQRTSEK